MSAVNACSVPMEAPDLESRQSTGGSHRVIRLVRPDPVAEASRDVLADCVRHGRRWRVSFAGRSAVVGHVVGLQHIAILVANPLQEIASIELAGGVNALGMSSRRQAEPAQLLVDREAVSNYRRRLGELRAEIERLDAVGDQHRATEVQVEFDWLVRELAAASGFSGRTRSFADNHERARIAVSKAIRRAITRVEQVDSVIGSHLRDSIYTGMRCTYQPAHLQRD
ncbi:hypothetical protein [Kribbella sp. NPDC049584]|uniref:hypothetical protein n=1 Tax=Kribbella sp. NPDC049584 TaxID=3154833 RepID=UPI003445E1D9